MRKFFSLLLLTVITSIQLSYCKNTENYFFKDVFRENTEKIDVVRSKSGNFDIFFRKEKILFNIHDSNNRYSAFSLNFEGCNEIDDLQMISENDHYLNIYKKDRIIEKQKTYAKVRYKNIYENIDIDFYYANGKLKYDIILKPGSNINDITMSYDGIDSLWQNDNKSYQIKVNNIIIKESLPYSYTKSKLGSEAHHISYTINKNSIKFESDYYFKDKLLVIDPELSWSTYIGGNSEDYGKNIIVDKDGNYVLAGITSSKDFPIISNQDSIKINGGRDVFITKFDIEGNLIWSTLIGSDHQDHVFTIVEDNDGNYWIGGESKGENLPTTQNALQKINNGGFADIFLCQFSNDGFLKYSTYLGGKGYDVIADMVIDNDGKYLWFIGRNTSRKITVTSDAYKNSSNGNYCGYIGKFNIINYKLDYASFFGGSDNDFPEGIAISNSGSIYISGYTGSTDIPLRFLGIQSVKKEGFDGFITKFRSDGQPVWSTYLGGTSDDYASNIDILNNGNIIIGGYTLSTDFIITSDGYQKYNAGNTDCFFTVLSEECKLVWSSYFGGDGNDGFSGHHFIDQSGDFDVSNNGNFVYTFRQTNSTNMPVTVDAFQGFLAGGNDAFVCEFDSNFNLFYSSYIGGSEDEQSFDVAYDDNGHFLLTGLTYSDDFPSTQGSFSEYFSGYYDAFLCAFTRECHQSAFDYPTLNSAEDFFFIGDATLEGDCFRLTTTEEYQRGAIWYAEPVPVKNGFIAEFSFRFSQPANNDFDDGSEPGADGIAFVLQNHSENALGSEGFGIGYAQIPNSIAVEFDTYANDNAQLNDMKDPNGNHIAVQTYGQDPNSPSHGGGAVKAIEDDIIPIHSDSSLYYARIDYNLIENTLRVYLSDTGYMSEPCIELKDFDISSIIDLSDGEFCWAGITSSTGNGWENHDIVEFSMCPFPTDAEVAVEDNAELYNDEISVYPNPASDFISIKVSAGFDGSYLKIVNLIGETIEEIKINDINDGIISYYTGDLSPGVYFIEISNSESKQHIKFIKK